MKSKEYAGVICILTNPSFPEYVKIGYRDIGEWDYEMTKEEEQPHIAELPSKPAEIPA